MSDPWTHHVAIVNGFRMHYVIAGKGYPIVLLHGWPQSWYAWRKVIPPLAEHFTVIAPDLRGLGSSDRPMTGYDKRTLATDVHALVGSLGFSKIGLAGHDWGAVAGFYLAYDHPEVIERLMILDAIPGLGRIGGKIDRQAARRFWHVLFHAGIPDLAETLVSTNVEAYLSYFYTSTAYNYSPAVFTKEDIAEYVRVYSAPGAIRAGFQYCSTALREDLENLSGCTRKLTIPVLAWGGQAFLGNIAPPGRTLPTTFKAVRSSDADISSPKKDRSSSSNRGLSSLDRFKSGPKRRAPVKEVAITGGSREIRYTNVVSDRRSIGSGLLRPALAERHEVIELRVPLDKLPAPVLAAIDVGVKPRADDALAIPGYAHLDGAGALRIVAVQLDDVVVDARQGHALFQSGIELVELLAAAHLDIGFLADDLIDKAAVVAKQVPDPGALAARHPMRVLGGQLLDLFPIFDLLKALFQCLHGSLLPDS